MRETVRDHWELLRRLLGIGQSHHNFAELTVVTCCELLRFPNFRNLLYLTNHLRACDDDWIRQFLENGGLERVVRACEKIFLRPIVSISDSLENLVAVNCLKVLINPETALRYFCVAEESADLMILAMESQERSIFRTFSHQRKRAKRNPFAEMFTLSEQIVLKY